MDTKTENNLCQQISDCVDLIQYWEDEVNNPNATFWPLVSGSMLAKSRQNLYRVLSSFS